VVVPLQLHVVFFTAARDTPERLAEYARAYHAYSDPLKRASISDHARMIQLLEGRDSDACERFWREHLYRGRDYMIEQLKTREVGE